MAGEKIDFKNRANKTSQRPQQPRRQGSRLTNKEVILSVGAINNPIAFSVYTSYAASSQKLSASMIRLSTGMKSVVDDGAGVGISERMRSQARSTSIGPEQCRKRDFGYADGRRMDAADQ